MNKIFSKDTNILKQEFLKIFIESLNALKKQEKIMIGLSGGNSFKIFYEKIKDNFSCLDKELREKIYFCFLDERIVDFSDDFSNYKLVKKLLLNDIISKGLLKQEQILLPNFSLENIEFDYFLKVKKIDIGFFGVGEDGHIASLFPNHKLLDDESYGYLKISDSQKMPKERISVSKHLLKDINYSFIAFMGDSKIQALNNFLNPNIDYKKCPAKLILETKNSFIISDNINIEKV